MCGEKRRHTILEVKDTRLAHVLELCARLADLRLLEPRTLARAPSKHGEWPCADLAFFSEPLLGHANVRVVAEAGLAEDREVLQVGRVTGCEQ